MFALSGRLGSGLQEHHHLTSVMCLPRVMQYNRPESEGMRRLQSV